MTHTTIQGEVTEEQVGRIDLMVRTLIDLPRSKLTALFEHCCVQLNNEPCTNPAARVSCGDKIVVTYDPHQGYTPAKRPWSDRTFSIIHEDEQLIVIDKAAGVLTVPTNKEESNTLLERISFFLSRKKKNHEAFLIHRLDRGLSGTMVFGKTPAAAKDLRTQFDHDKAKRIFFVLVDGVVEPDCGTFDSYLATHNNLSRYSTNDKKGGQRAITRFKVTRRMDDATALEIELVTARRHQARVHLAESGHPVIGDARYRSKRYAHQRWNRKRLAMHAILLTFIHPGTDQEVTFKSELPASLRKFMRGAKHLR